MHMRLKNKVAVVTGGGSGLGQAGARALAAAGACVVVADRDTDTGQATVASITQLGGAACFVQADITRAQDNVRMVKAAEREFGPLNVAFLCAGVQLHGRDGLAHEISEETWDRTHTINLKGMWLGCRALLPAMMRAGGGSLILAGSPTGLNGASGYTAYATSKAGSYALARTIAIDYARDHIRCNVLVPGPMQTPLTDALFADPQVRRDIENATIMKRLGQAEEIGGLLVFLASNEASYCTGGYYMADGGMTAL